MYRNSPYHRPVDNGPGTQIECRDVVGWANEATRPTCEFVPSGTVSLGDVPTRGALATGVSRVNNKYGHTCKASLVLDEAPKLGKPPIVQSCFLPLSGRNPVPDARQLFEGNSPAGALRFEHDCFADTVVLVPLVAGLSAGDSLELPLGRLRSFLLEVLAAVLMLAALIVYGCAGETLAVGIGCQVTYTQIHPKNFSRWNQNRLVHLAPNAHVPLPLDEHEIRLAATGGEQGPLLVAADERDLDTPLQGPDGCLVFATETEDPIIIGLRRMWPEGPLLLAKDLVRVHDLADATHGHLCREAKALSNFPVDLRLQAVDLEALVFPSLLADPVAGLVGPLQGCLQDRCLFGSGKEFDVCYQSHGFHNRVAHGSCQEKQRLSLHRLKSVASRRKGGS